MLFPRQTFVFTFLMAGFFAVRAVAVSVEPEGKDASYEVTFDGCPASVTSLFNGAGFGYCKRPIGYAQTVQSGPVEVVVSCGEPIRSFDWTPKRPGFDPRADGGQLHFRLAQAPAKQAVRINGRPWLFVFVDPDDPARPVSGRPGIFSVAQADCTGRRLVTGVLQKAIDEAARRAPATVLVPPGVYRTGSLWMKSGVTLYLAEGAVLLGAAADAAYPAVPYACQPRWPAAANPDCHAALLWFDGIHDAALRGRGVIDGQGSLRRDRWRGGSRKGALEARCRTNLIRVVDSARVTLEGVICRDSEFWAIHLLRSRGLHLANLKILNEMVDPGWDVRFPKSRWNNTDGIDVDACASVAVEDTLAYSGDDSFVLKTSNSGPLPPPPCEDVTFRRCMGAASTLVCKFGTESLAPFRRVSFEDMDILAMNGTQAMGLGFMARDTASLEAIVFRRVRFDLPCKWLDVESAGRSKGQAKTVTLRALSFEGIDLKKGSRGKIAGLSGANSVRDIRFSGVTVEGRPALTLKAMGIEAVHIRDVRVEGQPVTVEP